MFACNNSVCFCRYRSVQRERLQEKILQALPRPNPPCGLVWEQSQPWAETTNWRKLKADSSWLSSLLLKSQGKAGAVDLALLISNSPQMWEISNPAWFQVCHQGKVTQRQHSSPAEQRQHWSFFPLSLNPHSFNATARAGNKCSS